MPSTAAQRRCSDAPMTTSHDLARFVRAQDAPAGAGSIYDMALAELRAGEKKTHWMWFVLPQLRGLGTSEMSQKYAIVSLAEARAYIAHPVLGPRLRECVAALNALEGRTAFQIFGRPDDRKFRACITLFGYATGDNKVFETALNKYFPGGVDKQTVKMLGF